MSLSLEDILSKEDKHVRKVPCPEWGGDCFVRTLSSDERDAWEIAVEEDKKTSSPHVRASLVGVALCDEHGTPLKPTAAQIAGLGGKASGPMDRLFDAVLELNRMRKSDVEKLEKNSEPTAVPD